jgi:hypothetical protein
MSTQQRINRINKASHVVWLEDSSIHLVADHLIMDNKVWVETQGGLLFLDEDILTLEEACDIERQLETIKREVGIS